MFVGSGIFKSGNPETRAKAMVQAVTHYSDFKLLGEVSEDLGEPMVKFAWKCQLYSWSCYSRCLKRLQSLCSIVLMNFQPFDVHLIDIISLISFMIIVLCCCIYFRLGSTVRISQRSGRREKAHMTTDAVYSQLVLLQFS